MLKIFIILVLFGLSSSQNAGFVYSRGISDMQSAIQSAAPQIFSELKINSIEKPSFQATDDLVVLVTVALSNIALSNFTVNSSNIIISFTSSRQIGVSISGLKFVVTADYTEQGFSINKAGKVTSSISNSQMVMNLVAYFLNNTVTFQVDPSNFTLNVLSLSTSSDTMDREVLRTTSVNIQGFLNTVEFTGTLPPQISVYLSSYFQNVNHQIPIPGTSLYMNSSLVYPGIQIGDSYLSYQVNGGIIDGKMPMNPALTPPASIPYRITPRVYGESQLMISNYTLATYFNAYNQAYPVINITKLPAGYPNLLATNSGFFPELLAIYGAKNMSLTFNMTAIPSMYFLSNGIMFKSSIDMCLFVLNNSQYNQAACFAYSFYYQCTPYIDQGFMLGTCFKPDTISFTITDGPVTLSVYNSERFVYDLVTLTFWAGNTDFYFPRIPLNYPSAAFELFGIVYTDSYFVLEYNPTYSS